MSTLHNGTILGKKWRIDSFIGEGACGKVYAVSPTGINPSQSIPLVAKVVPLPTGTGKAFKDKKRICDTLFYEGQQMIGQLLNFPYLPKIPDVTNFRGVDETHGVRFMVMERLDRDLADFSRSNPPPTAAEIGRIGLQLLAGLEWLHNKGLMFVDVKPDNFMLRGNDVVFIDYGCTERWADAAGAKAQEVRGGMAGTPAYVSLSVHNLYSPSRRDDLEAMGLVLLSMFDGGSLPWSEAKSDAECKRMKENCDIMKLATERNCPEIGELILKCRGYAHEKKPDYADLRSLLEKLCRSKASAAPSNRKLSSSPLPSSTKKRKGANSSSSSSSAVAAGRGAPVEVEEDVVVLESEPTVAPTADARTNAGKGAKAKATATTKKAKVPVDPTAKNVSSPAAAAPTNTRARVVAETPSLPRAATAPSGSGSGGAKARAKPRAGPTPSGGILSMPTVTLSDDDDDDAAPGGAAVAEEEARSPVRKSARVKRRESSLGPFSPSSSSQPFSPTSRRSSLASVIIDLSSDEVPGPEQTLRMIVVDGPHKGEEWVLGKSTAQKVDVLKQRIIGRESGDLELPNDEYLSQKHLKAMWCWNSAGDLELNLQDMKSSNGTKLNGKKLEAKRWELGKSGDILKMGETKIEIRCAAAAAGGGGVGRKGARR